MRVKPVKHYGTEKFHNSLLILNKSVTMYFLAVELFLLLHDIVARQITAILV